MNKKNIYKLINNENVLTVSSLLLNYAKKIKLDADSIILLIYLINGKNGIIFDYKRIMDDLEFSEQDILAAISVLKDKNILSIEMRKNEFGILEEILNIDSLYDLLFMEILNKSDKEKLENDLYTAFEKEFGRTLSPMEIEIITNWRESGIKDELILAALRESIFNGVSNLRYVDKILYEWNKKGIKDASEINVKKKEEEENGEEANYEYDWLNE